jgi:hypothetical protein
MLSLQNLKFFSVFFDRSERIVREWWLLGVFQFDVREFLAANNALLRLNRESIPSLHVVKILLDNDVAAARKGWIFVTDNCSLVRRTASRIFCAVSRRRLE